MKTSPLTFKARLYAALCYIPPLFAFAAFSRGADDFLSAHLRCGLRLFLYGVCGVLAANVLGFFAAFLPVFGGAASNLPRIAAWALWTFFAARGAFGAMYGKPARG